MDSRPWGPATFEFSSPASAGPPHPHFRGRILGWGGTEFFQEAAAQYLDSLVHYSESNVPPTYSFSRLLRCQIF